MPLHHREHVREDAEIREATDETLPRKTSLSLPPAELLADQAQLLRLVNDNFRLARSDSSSSKFDSEHIRSTSSSYPEQGVSSTRIQSPVSDLGIPKLSLGDLSQYSRANDRLSNLRSSSSSSRVRPVSAESTREAVSDASAAVKEWQRQPLVSYHRYELSHSIEDLPTESTRARNSEQSRESQSSSDGTVVTQEINQLKIMDINSQCNGVAEQSHPQSPSPSVEPRRIWPRVLKRSASGISLRSLTRGVKRSRTEVKRLASSAYHSSSHRLGQARESIKRHHGDQKKQYSAWKAMRRKFKPGDAIKRKPEKGFATFSVERSQHGHQTWWKTGVKKFRSPTWMQFGK
ncbi:hypothetical protein FZEAL_7184 [Fusarium zealandicum]|uniref:Uncharacterized protein n=1 Tax=Fusarium zealandicum TaxID=1053134 RepID=A0A8H4XIW1_9HYPO|nr:hypothetical protein FZEAL_7184 [Fusarium zealandicum]